MGTENLDQRTPSTSETGQGRRFPRLNYPPLKKPKGSPASRCHPEEAESRHTRLPTKDLCTKPRQSVQARASSFVETGNKSVVPSAAEGPLCLSILTPPSKRCAPSFRALCGKVGRRESRRAHARRARHGDRARTALKGHDFSRGDKNLYLSHAPHGRHINRTPFDCVALRKFRPKRELGRATPQSK